MHDLRLVPTAATCWGAVVLLLVTGSPVWAVALLVVVVTACMVCRLWQHAVLVAGFGGAAVFIATVRLWRAAAFAYPTQLHATVAGHPKPLDHGGYYLPVSVDGLAPTLALFAQEPDRPDALARGAHIVVDATYREADRPGLAPVVVRGEITEISPPTGIAQFAHSVAQSLHQASHQYLGENTASLLPGMVLGDTSGQTSTERQMYIDAGLTHLTAVSGLHVATVVATAVIVTKAIRMGPVGQSVAASCVLALYVCVVGPAPSVLRASITGLVGLAAIMNSSRMPPLHALCIAVITLLFFDSDLAVAFGFALSVAATAGIISLTPLLYRPLARSRLPDIIVRALAVSIAADIVTMPLVSLLAGRVSVVSVIANVVVTPAIAPALIIGLAATVLAVLALPIAVEAVAFAFVEPAAWWIYRVAKWAQDLPVATIEISPWAALIAYGWILAAILAGFIRTTTVVLVAAMFLAGWNQRLPPQAEITADNVLVVKELEQVTDYSGQFDPATVPPGIDAIVVTDSSGKPATRPTATPSGIPIVFPNRDGPVTIHIDGTQHADNGAF
ncbi:ComEC/Rec2 family competence protein [Corynebacterium sp. MNWGS58]|uniref:ComEC/Rec2 family competence protein n=1 Tax=Corynebacterium sp. 102791.4 TaxID=3104612 RepID=UPI003512B281